MQPRTRCYTKCGYTCNTCEVVCSYLHFETQAQWPPAATAQATAGPAGGPPRVSRGGLEARHLNRVAQTAPRAPRAQLPTNGTTPQWVPSANLQRLAKHAQLWKSRISSVVARKTQPPADLPADTATIATTALRCQQQECNNCIDDVWTTGRRARCNVYTQQG